MTIEIRPFEDGELEAMISEDTADRARHALTRKNVAPLLRYIVHRIPPGDFLMAVLCNDLRGAAGRADLYNRRKLFEYVQWLYNEAPATCWGSKEDVAAWLKGE